MSATVPHLTALPGLFASTPQRLPFAPDLEVRAFVLQRPDGNVLLYSSRGLDEDADALRALGGIDRWYLNHWHEAMFAAAAVDAPLLVHERDRDEAAKRLRVRASFSRRHMLGDDLEVIPTPGHTPGATAYLWESGGHRMLFTGDTVYLHDGEWVTAVLDSSDRRAYAESLALLRELDFDVLVPWATSAGQPAYAFTDDKDRRRRIDALLSDLERSG